MGSGVLDAAAASETKIMKESDSMDIMAFKSPIREFTIRGGRSQKFMKF